MALVLYLEKRRMPEFAKRVFQDCLTGDVEMLISPISLAEIGYLSERGRIDTTIADVLGFIRDNAKITLTEMDGQTVVASFQITDIPELHDRLIAGAAVQKTAVVLTNDPVIRKSSFVESRWANQ